MKEIVSIFAFFLLATLLSCAQNDIWEALLPDRDGQYTSKPVYTIHLYKTGNDWMDMDITGEDGELQKGLAWPPARFYDNGDGTVTDTMTGLMWEQSPSSPADTWDASLGYAASKGTGGYFDWRMPNRNELRSLINYQTGTQLSVRLNSQGFALFKTPSIGHQQPIVSSQRAHSRSTCSTVTLLQRQKVVLVDYGPYGEIPPQSQKRVKRPAGTVRAYYRLRASVSDMTANTRRGSRGRQTDLSIMATAPSPIT